MFYDIYADLCKQVGKSPSAVAQELGINKSNVTNWKNNGYTPRGNVLNRIAEYFNVPTDYLLGISEPKEKPSQPDELEGVYLSFAREAQESRIDPKDIMLAIETIKKLRGD